MLAFATLGPSNYTSRIYIGSPASMAPKLVAGYAHLIGFDWSPDGADLAVSYRSSPPGSGGVLAVRPLDAKAAHAVYQLPGYGDALLAGWWPSGRGLLFWADPVGSASIAADGLTLKDLNLGTGKATTLATTLVHDEWLSWSPNGGQVAIVAGGDRDLWDWGKHVEVCTVLSGSCLSPALPTPAGQWMSLGPTWAGPSTMVYSVAPAAPANSGGVPAGVPFKGGWDNQDVAAWYNEQRLYYWQSFGAGPRPVPGAPTGAHDPLAISGGLLYTGHDALWYMPLVSGQSVSSGPPRQLAAGLPLGLYGNFFAHVDWAADYAWHPS